MDCVVSSSNYSLDYWNASTIRILEKQSIQAFVQENKKYLTGRVLDYGAGKPGTCAQPQPYKQYITGEYVPYDLGDPFPNGPFDAILCTQVLQYIENLSATFDTFNRLIKPGGHLVLTYPTAWDDLEDCDYWRFTKAGLERYLDLYSKLVILKHERRAQIELKGFKFPLGYGVVARKPGPYTKLDADESASLLTNKIRNHEPFIYVRYGDGAIECIHGLGSKTCDGEGYTAPLAVDLLECWETLLNGKKDLVYLGDWLSASFNPQRDGEYAKEYTKMVGTVNVNWLHFEALLFMRHSAYLSEFYKAIAADTRRVVYMGPKEMAPVMNLLGCAHHIVTPMENLYDSIDRLEDILNYSSFDVLLYGAGMAGNIPVIRHWSKHPEKTYIHLGSALDPLYRGKTRKTQLSQAQVRQSLNALF